MRLVRSQLHRRNLRIANLPAQLIYASWPSSSPPSVLIFVKAGFDASACSVSNRRAKIEEVLTETAAAETRPICANTWANALVDRALLVLALAQAAFASPRRQSRRSAKTGDQYALGRGQELHPAEDDLVAAGSLVPPYPRPTLLRKSTDMLRSSSVSAAYGWQ